MPEASVDKDGRMVLAHDDIRFPRHTFHIEPIAVAVSPQPLPHLNLRLGIAAAYVRHHEVALGGGENIGHLLSQLFEMQNSAFFDKFQKQKIGLCSTAKYLVVKYLQ